MLRSHTEHQQRLVATLASRETSLSMAREQQRTISLSACAISLSELHSVMPCLLRHGHFTCYHLYLRSELPTSCDGRPMLPKRFYRSLFKDCLCVKKKSGPTLLSGIPSTWHVSRWIFLLVPSSFILSLIRRCCDRDSGCLGPHRRLWFFPCGTNPAKDI